MSLANKLGEGTVISASNTLIRFTRLTPVTFVPFKYKDK